MQSEDKNILVLSSKNVIHERVELDENSDLNQFPLIKQLFSSFIKSVTLDKHLLIIEKLDFLNWEEVQDDVIEQIENYLNKGGVIYSGNVNALIYAESTQIPVMKFVCNKRLVNISHEFKKIDETEHCNIAKALFLHDFISEVYIDLNFISITIKEDYSWENHTMEIRNLFYPILKMVMNWLIKVDKAKSTNKAIK